MHINDPASSPEDSRSFAENPEHVPTSVTTENPPASIHACTAVSEQRTLNIMMRVSEHELAALRQRCPEGADLSTWMRGICLGPVPAAESASVDKGEGKRAKRVMIRVSERERTTLLGRSPQGMDLSSWMRTACLAQPILREVPAPDLVAAPAPTSEAELIRARAFMALVQMCSEQIERFRRESSVESIDGLRRILREILADLEKEGINYDL